MIINILSLSPVAKISKLSVLSFGQQGLELLEMFCLNRVNSAEHVPIHERCARRSGQRSLIGPSVVEVHQLHQVAISYKIGHWVLVSVCIVPLETLEECVNDLNFGLSQICGSASVREQNTHSCQRESFNCLGVFGGGCWFMNRLNFKVFSLTIDRVLRLGMENHMVCLVVIVSTKNAASKRGLESASSLIVINGNFCCVSGPLDC